MRTKKVEPRMVDPAEGFEGELYKEAEVYEQGAAPGWEQVFDAGFKLSQNNPRKPVPDIISLHPRALVVGPKVLEDNEMMRLFELSGVEWRDIMCEGRGSMRLAIIRRMWQFDSSILKAGSSGPLWEDLWGGRLIGVNPDDKTVPLQVYTVPGEALGGILVFDWASELSFVRLYQKRKYTGLVFSTV